MSSVDLATELVLEFSTVMEQMTALLVAESDVPGGGLAKRICVEMEKAVGLLGAVVMEQAMSLDALKAQLAESRFA